MRPARALLGAPASSRSTALRECGFTCHQFSPRSFYYGVRMWRFERRKILTLLIIISMGFEEGESGRFAISGVGVTSAKELEDDEGNESEGPGGRQCLVEGGDRAEVSNSSERGGGGFDYATFEPRSEPNAEDEETLQTPIRTCCGWDDYLDAERLLCVPLAREDSSKHEFFRKRVGARRSNESEQMFLEGMPDCGGDSVIAVRGASSVSVSVAGVFVDGKEFFSKYCIDADRLLRPVVLACHEAAAFCKVRPCFRKCCPLGFSYASFGRKCQKTKEPFEPEFYDVNTLSRVDPPSFSECGMYLADACGAKGKYLLERKSGEMSYLGLDGTLFVPAFKKRFSEREFCIESVKSSNRSGIESFLCFSGSGSHFENSQLQFFLLSLGFMISCMFLLLTFLVYLFSPKSQKLYGKTLMCYVVSLFTAYLCLAVIELRSKEINKTVCTNLGYFLLFSFLAAFFWLNVMSFDLWKTFRSNRSSERSRTAKVKLRFFCYSVYAWTFPSVITGVCAYVNQIEDFPYKDLRPDIGEENCWFSKKRKGIYLFFIAPISLIIAINIIFYIQTAWKIWKVRSDVKNMEQRKTKRFSANKNQFIINGKLFVVMGITWSLEIISFFAPHPIWYITDTANALHGVFIFAVFAFKKKVIHKLCQQMKSPLKWKNHPTASNTARFSAKKNFRNSNDLNKS